MTLIAQMSINGVPFLVGDVLLSSETRMGLKVNLPLVGDINQILANNGFPFEVGFAQKINVFDGRIAVAWSGPSIQAKRALQVIADISPRENLTVDNILSELKAIDQTKLDQLQLIGLLLEEVIGTTVKASVFALRVPRTEIRAFGNAYVAGSGRSAFLNLVQNGNWQPPATEYQFVHGLLGVLTNEEYRTGNTITNKWGGGFEALTFSPISGRFEKVGDVLHTFWEMTENNDDSLGLFPFFYKTTYWRDALVLRTASLEKNRDSDLTLKTNDITLIPPLLRDVNEYNISEIGKVDFSYRAVCCHVIIRKTDNRDLLLLIDQRESGQDVLFEVDEFGARLQISHYLPDIIREQLHAKEPVGTNGGS